MGPCALGTRAVRAPERESPVRRMRHSVPGCPAGVPAGSGIYAGLQDGVALSSASDSATIPGAILSVPIEPKPSRK